MIDGVWEKNDTFSPEPTAVASVADSDPAKFAYFSQNNNNVPSGETPRPLSQFILRKESESLLNGDGNTELIVNSDKNGSSILTPQKTSFAVTTSVPVALKPIDARISPIPSPESKRNENRSVVARSGGCERIEYPLYDSDESEEIEFQPKASEIESSVVCEVESSSRIVRVKASADEELLLPLLCDHSCLDALPLFRRYLSLLSRNR